MTAATLRPYQLSVVRETSTSFQAKLLYVLIQMATGAGKTRTAAYIVGRFVETGRQCLWTVHREELLMQAAMVFAEMGIKHRVICSTSSERAIKAQQFREYGRSFVDTSALVVVGSIQTIVRRLDDRLAWLDPDLIVPDEAHLSLNATNRKIITTLIDRRDHRLTAEYGSTPTDKRTRVLGLTATPRRLDRQSFRREHGGLYDVMVQGPSMRELIDWGNLAKYRVFAPPIELVAGIDLGKRKGGDYDAHELERELDAPKVYGDVVEHYRKYSHGKPAIGFCPTLHSASAFAESFRAAGYRAIALDGDTDDTVRRQSLQKLGRGELDVVMSVQILVEGTDVPYATTALMLRRTESVSLYLQAVGRVLRPHPEKENAIILDFVGLVAKHGMPDEDREWSLDAETKRARQQAANDNDEPGVDRVQTCPKCFSMHLPAPVCPTCGHVHPAKERREAEHVDVDLVEITAAEADKLRRARRLMQGKAQSVAELVGQGINRFRAEKIVAAREAKAAQRVELLSHVQKNGGSIYGVLGVTMRDFMAMKPKELSALKTTIEERELTA